MSSGSDSLVATREQSVPTAYQVVHPIVVDRAEGSFVWDEDGRRYVDFAGGIAVANVGHGDPSVVAAIHLQVDKLLHTGPVTINRPSVELAQRLTLKAPQGADWQTLFVNSGAEAVETAVKIARHATGRPAIIAFDRSFHGRTLLTATLTGKVKPHKTQPGAMAPEVYHAPYPDPYRRPVGVSESELVESTIDYLDNLTLTRVASEGIAAVLVEPILGEGGIVVPPDGFLSRLAEWCRARGILLIVDEIQTGYGRTGTFFAFEHDGVVPDIITVGKSIADGLPLAGVIAQRAVWNQVVRGDVGGTFAGNPVSCAAGLAVIDLFADGSLLARGKAIGRLIRDRLSPLEPLPQVGEIRGRGPMLAIEFVVDPESRKPNDQLAAHVLTRCREDGLLLLQTGIWGNCLRILPPLIADDEVVDQAVAIINGAVLGVIGKPRVSSGSKSLAGAVAD